MDDKTQCFALPRDRKITARRTRATAEQAAATGGRVDGPDIPISINIWSQKNDSHACDVTFPRRPDADCDPAVWVGNPVARDWPAMLISGMKERFLDAVISNDRFG